jgi:uncharacterized protein (TIGR02757 family)
MPGRDVRVAAFSPFLAELLEEKYHQYNVPGFIPFDPVSIPHLFSRTQDIEISGFFAATLAWGQRKTIISKCRELMALMDGAPYDFIRNHEESDLKPLERFKHRTFQATDLLYFVHFLKTHYLSFESLEDAFLPPSGQWGDTTEAHLTYFHDYFCGLAYFPDRTRKHIATPARKSTCKRLSMFLRWMVRVDDSGVDFGLWRRLSPAQLVCPCDVHVDRVGRKLGLISRPGTDWGTAVELTLALRTLDPLDPVKYDFALFGMGVEGEF